MILKGDAQREPVCKYLADNHHNIIKKLITRKVKTMKKLSFYPWFWSPSLYWR